MPRKRDVSPLGTSKYERPYSPPSAKTTPATTPASSPTEASYPNLPFSRYHATRASAASTTATYSTATYSTAPTSIDSTLDRPSADAEPKPLVNPEQRYLSPPLPEDDPTDEEDEYEEGDVGGQDSAVGSWSAEKESETTSSVWTGSDRCPDAARLAAVQDFPIYDVESKPTRFGSLFHHETAACRRQLIIFLRYWFCPACTAYLHALAESINEEEQHGLPISTSITIIGCGQPDLIRHYQKFTGCRWPMYSDPSRTLFKRLGMSTNLKLGKKPGHTDKGLLGQSRDEIRIISKSLKDPDGLRKRDLLRGGHPMQVGGEFLFEGGQVVWCHRMRDYRGHAEIEELRRLIGLDE